MTTHHGSPVTTSYQEAVTPMADATEPTQPIDRSYTAEIGPVPTWPPPTLGSDCHRFSSHSEKSSLCCNFAAFKKKCKYWWSLNAVQRVLSSLVLAPAVTGFLWGSPAFFTATICSFLTSTCAYEYAWLEHRIHTRITTQLERTYRTMSSMNNDSRGQFGSSTTRNSSPPCESDEVCFDNVTREIEAFDNTEESEPVDQAEVDERSEAECKDPLLYMEIPDASIDRCAISDIANRYFGGHQRLAAASLSLFSAAFMSSIFLAITPHVTQLRPTDLYHLRYFYAPATDFISSFCAFQTPNWSYALSCLAQKAVFTILTMHSTICPINQFTCGLAMEPAQIFISGSVVLLFLRLYPLYSVQQTDGSGLTRVSLLILALLDLLGYLYVVGPLSVIVSFVDDERLEEYRKLLIVLLYVVWASDSGAYLTGKFFERVQYKNYHPLAPHLSKNKDYEGTLGAIGFGVMAMFIASDILSVEGDGVVKSVFTILAVIAGRIGDLFESLLKRAAGVKDSGRLIPGHGGMLDRIDALMFASIVFARYYATIVVGHGGKRPEEHV